MISSTTACAASSLRLLTTTWAPCAARPFARARPIPRPAPVTTATLSASRPRVSVTSRLDEGDGGRTRRYFKLTRQGLAVVKQTRIEHTRLWRGLARLLGSHKS